jgi:phosphate:Na+ symporter
MPQVIAIICHVFGGLGIFLLGMKNMSDGMQAVAGERMRKLIGLTTNNPLLGIGSGMAVTGIIQSSSVTTVMIVGMVNAGLMTLKQSIGVILGANIGTTITAWIMAYSLEQYGLPIVGFSALFYLFSKSDRIRFFAVFVLGLGMVFFGLDLMKQGLTPIRSMPEFIAWFSRFQADSYLGIVKCILVGAAVTAIVQSSSATVGITMALAGTGIIDFPTAAGLILGENIGTTITPVLASLGTTINAKRAAYAHVFFNAMGVLWITPLFFILIKGIIWFTTSFLGCENPDVAVYTETASTYPYAEKAIATAHTGFKMMNVLVFLPWIGIYTKLLRWLFPEKVVPETPKLTYLDVRLYDTPLIALQQSDKEIIKMGKMCQESMAVLREAQQSDMVDRNRIEKIFQTENDLDVMQKEIVEFLGSVITGNLSHNMIHENRRQIRMADEFESISDYIAGVIKLRLKMGNNNLHLSDEARREMPELHNKVSEFLDFVISGITEDNINPPEFLSQAHTRNNAITSLIKETRTKHLARVECGKASPLKSLIYTDMLTSYRRIKDHILNIAEVAAGEK